MPMRKRTRATGADPVLCTQTGFLLSAAGAADAAGAAAADAAPTIAYINRVHVHEQPVHSACLQRLLNHRKSG